jgi:hypothetical protein
MIITANKYVNARLNNPYTSSPNPRFLKPGDKVNIKARVFGETLEGNNEWLLTDENEYFTQLGFNVPVEISDIPFENVPLLFKQLEISKLWSLSKGEDVNIGVIDITGVANYPALKDRVIPLNYKISDADITSHSTCMASIIGGNDIKNNEIGIAPLINKIYSYKIPNESLTPKQLFDSLSAFIGKDVQIINMSIASTVFNIEDYADLKDILSQLIKADVIIVGATGNEPIHKQSVPSALKGVISVSGFVMGDTIDWDGNSNVWDGVNISAPYNKYFDKTFEEFKGTSNACAIISGILACSYKRILSKKDKLNCKEFITNQLFSSFDKILYPVNDIRVPLYNTSQFINLLK